MEISIDQLKWETLKIGRKGSRLIFLYKDLRSKASVSSDDVNLKTLKTGGSEILIHRCFISHTLKLMFICTVLR